MLRGRGRVEFFGRLESHQDDMPLVGLVTPELVVRPVKIVKDAKYPVALVEPGYIGRVAGTEIQGRNDTQGSGRNCLFHTPHASLVPRP